MTGGETFFLSNVLSNDGDLTRKNKKKAILLLFFSSSRFGSYINYGIHKSKQINPNHTCLRAFDHKTSAFEGSTTIFLRAQKTLQFALDTSHKISSWYSCKKGCFSHRIITGEKPVTCLQWNAHYHCLHPPVCWLNPLFWNGENPWWNLAPSWEHPAWRHSKSSLRSWDFFGSRAVVLWILLIWSIVTYSVYYKYARIILFGLKPIW